MAEEGKMGSLSFCIGLAGVLHDCTTLHTKTADDRMIKALCIEPFIIIFSSAVLV